ncbi:MAG: FG-GAP-like repeat-containing protein, partial [Verrucomicrobiota bacterium]
MKEILPDRRLFLLIQSTLNPGNNVLLKTLAAILLIGASSLSSVLAETVVITADRDNTIYSNNGSRSNGEGEHLISGRIRNASGAFRRLLVHFDVAAHVPAGATLNSVTLSLNVNRTVSVPGSFAFHRITQDWGEGTSNAGGIPGRGVDAENNDATWGFRFFNTTNMWNTLGGDFKPSVSATQIVGGVGRYDWSSPELMADVQDMLDNAATNFGWILIGPEGTNRTTKRFDSRQSPMPSSRPQLTIDYTLATTITADRDNTIFSNNGGRSNGQGVHIIAGRIRNASGAFRRLLLHFDVAAQVPAGATIDSATLFLNMNLTVAGPGSFAFHRVSQDWGEGVSDAGIIPGRGVNAENNDVTWSFRFFNTPDMWNTLGGDFNPIASVTQTVDAVGPYNWSSPQLTADVQDMLDNGATNFGWMLVGPESVSRTTKRFDSRESANPSNRPQLILEFSLPRPPLAVTNVSPAQTAVGVPADGNISAAFDAPPNITTVNETAFKIWGKQTGFKSGSYGFSGADFDPVENFKPGERVHVMLSSNILGIAGGGLRPFVSEFTVGTVGCTNLRMIAHQALGGNNSSDVALGDLDGDGDLDAFVANYFQGNIIWTNNGSGSFGNRGQILGTARSLNVALGDLDNDGDLDAFVANDMGANAVWTNQGNGTFAGNGQFLDAGQSFGVDLGDLDGDGDLDALVANDGSNNKIWWNDGQAQFVDSGQALGAVGSRHCALGDLDGDGDLDAFVAVSGGGDLIWTNDGGGTFALHQTLASNDSFGVDLGDLDGDGDLDAFVTDMTGAGNRVWTNDGTGTFSDSGQAIGAVPGRSVDLGDVDGDGDLDAILANPAPNTNSIWLNDGVGGFSTVGDRFGDRDHQDLGLGDLNGDGDLDILVVNQFQPNDVFLNFHCAETNDFDNDGIPDGVEVNNQLDPTDPNPAQYSSTSPLVLVT